MPAKVFLRESRLNTSKTNDANDSSRPARRRFLRNSTLATLAAALGGPIPFARNLAPGLFPDALAQTVADLLPDKRGLRILGDRPIVAETPPTLLDDDITPIERHFVRNNGHPPERAAKRDLTDWSLTIDGEVEMPLKLTLAELQSQFPKVTRALVIECAGNGRAAFNPPASGNQWTLGGVGCSSTPACASATCYAARA